MAGNGSPRPRGLLLVPGRADAEPGPAAGEDVERRDALGQQAGLPVDHRGHPGEQLDPRRAGGQVAESGVGLEHLVLGRPDDADLPDMVHDAQLGEARLLRRDRDRGQVSAEPLRAAGPGEIRQVQAKFHEPSFRWVT